MASYDVSTGLSGGASGAATGFQVGGPVGAGIGGGLGLLSGFFGGDDGGSDARRQAIGRNRESLRALTDQYNARLEESPTETSFFQAGAAQLQEQADRQADRDAAAAAARGLTGSQFEVAQDATRAQEQARGLRALVSDAEQIDNRNERQALQATQRQRESLNALVSDQARGQARRNQNRNAMLQQVFANLPYTMSAINGGGGGGANQGTLTGRSQRGTVA